VVNEEGNELELGVKEVLGQGGVRDDGSEAKNS